MLFDKEVLYQMQFHINAVRENKNISLRELAAISGISKSTITRIEAGQINPTVSTMCKLAKALNVPASDLFSCD